MNILKNTGMVNDLIINTKPSSDGKTRAKATSIEINTKKVKFPGKTIHTSLSSNDELTLIKKEIDLPSANEIAIQITPKLLREIIGDPRKHQEIKENIRKKSIEKYINIGYPLLLNQRSSHEDKVSFKPFGKPTQRIIEKIFDLFDVENMDVIILPSPSPNGNSVEWCKLATDIFLKRKSEFMNEFLISGVVPLGNPENHVKEIIEYYLKNNIQALSFDFCRRKVLESRMREILESYIGIEKWEKMFIHGTNVPANNSMAYREPTLGLYDILVSVYGFDAFGGIISGGGDLPEKNKIKETMRRKRFRFIDTYGDYNYDGLKILSEQKNLKLNSSILKTSNPIEIYDEKTATIPSFLQLSKELRNHRNYVTHKEMNKFYDLINNKKFLSHIQEKKASAKELNSILNEFQIEKLNKFY